MNYTRERSKDLYLRDTAVENIFLNEYMAQAEGDHVKVFLLALMNADHDAELDNEKLAKQLGLAIEDVLKAWSYWEQQGVIKKHLVDPKDPFRYEVEFLRLRERVFGNRKQKKKSDGQVSDQWKGLLENPAIRDMYAEIERITGRLFEGKEMSDLLAWITDYNLPPELVVYAYSYCVTKRNNNKHKYVASVIKEWAESGFRSIDEVEEYLSETDQRHYQYKRVLKAMGMFRNPTEEERRIMDIWLDEYHFDLDKVLEACKKTSGISNPNINYVHSILKAWNSGEERPKGGAAALGDGKINPVNQIFQAYEKLRMKREQEAEERRQQVYQSLPRIQEIEDEQRTIGLQISRQMLSGSQAARDKIRELKARVDQLNAEKAYTMTEHNLRPDYMDVVYDCVRCKDTGTLEDGQRCSCFQEKLLQL